ncbi:hypothetical protein GPJ56_006941 [Histomonas meleagridis]|uniref:uncharacterized protein n=1 Tax=Histomonas meleagridis TaxID=135588 RepID=UPI00355A7FD5|nr:hypothetical protein GPJ56_006941 [Histomonas meleagridis]KAH0802201.1 hypothetical protein GO595_004814 [Histomonas meleagridis]
MKLWRQIEVFIDKNSKVKSPTFNQYIEAIELWERKDNLNDFEESLNQARNISKQVATVYGENLNKIASSFVQKAQITENIEKTLRLSEKRVNLTKERFTIDPKALLQPWKKSLKYQKEIEILDVIKYLVQTPSISIQLLENGNILESVNRLQTALQIFKDNDKMNFAALNDVKKKLESCKRKITNTIFENLFKKLFFTERPPNLSFFNTELTPDEISQIGVDPLMEQSCQALFVLQEQNQFIEDLIMKMASLFSQLMVDTLKEIKVKPTRSKAESKDLFSEFVDIYQNNSVNNPIIAYFDALLCKIWVLFVRCDKIDHFLPGQEKVTLVPIWNNFSIEIKSLITAFTVTLGDKHLSSHKLIYKLVSEDDSGAEGKIHNYIRQKLGVRHSKFNFLLIYPLVNKFRDLVIKVFNFRSEIDELKNKLSFDLLLTEKLIKQDLKEPLTKVSITQRTINVDGFSAPIFMNTPTYIKNIYHFTNASEQFDFIKNTLLTIVLELIHLFCTECEKQLNTYVLNQPNNFYSAKLLNDISRYERHPLVQSMIFDGKTTLAPTLLNQFEHFELENEKDLWNGTKLIEIEETIRESFQLPLLATIAESLLYFTSETRKIINEHKNLFHKTLHEQIQNELKNANSIAVKCICFIHIEMRCKCYNAIATTFTGASYKFSNNASPQEENIVSFLKTYKLMSELLSHKLTQSLYLFAFVNLPKLVFNLFVRFIPKITEINENGSKVLTNDVTLLNQAFILLFQDLYQEDFRKAFWFTTNAFLSSERLFAQIKLAKKSFTFEELEPIFEMPQKAAEQFNGKMALRQLYGFPANAKPNELKS